MNNKFEYFNKESLIAWNDANYDIEYFGNNLEFIVLGEEHHSLEIKNKQIELINRVKPEYVLLEHITAWTYNPKNLNFTKQENRIIGEYDQNVHDLNKDWDVRGLTNESNKLGFEIIGCDLTNAELLIVAGQINKNIYEDDINYKKFKLLCQYIILEEIIQKSEEFIPYREQKKIEIINNYKNKSKNTVIVILGDYHAKNLHEQKKLQELNIEYAYVSQGKKEEDQ